VFAVFAAALGQSLPSEHRRPVEALRDIYDPRREKK
jgi:hypothetical protein